MASPARVSRSARTPRLESCPLYAGRHLASPQAPARLLPGHTFDPSFGVVAVLSTPQEPLAQALAHEACRRGYEVLFVSTAKMLTHLAGGRADGMLAHRLAKYLRPALLVLDDFGLKPLRVPGPEDLYDIIHERYERASIVLTSNRDRSEWADLFGEPLLASAALDRLTHRAHFVEMV